MALTRPVRSIHCLVSIAILFLLFSVWGSADKLIAKPVAPALRCADLAARDQDDMCVWVHPTDRALSTLVVSDKRADKLFVYDLAGRTLQVIPAKHPGNIDVRYGFSIGKERVDIIAVNQRDDPKILVYQMTVATRQLERVDNGAITTGENYGGTLYHSVKTGRLYFIVTSKSGLIEQYELTDDGHGSVRGNKKRSWMVGGQCESAVADDEVGSIYIGQEDKGVWELGGEPGDPAPGRLVVTLGKNGLVGDIEGLAIYYLPKGRGYLIVSNQSRDNFKVFRREGAHEFVGTFAIAGVKETDGLDVVSADLGFRFPSGLFACHSAEENQCPVLLTPWASIATVFQPELEISTVWNPRM
ncbi:MAG: phytase [Sedimentisphaerales bacterium]|nr:phytase [Sedimentisphaerales bacterium]